MSTLDQSIHTGAAGPSLAGAIADFARHVRSRWEAARSARAAKAHLLGMSDRDLRDIGLTRFELHRVYGEHGI
jgi:uncharacterized protein YjiS (DUF1127 family)